METKEGQQQQPSSVAKPAPETEQPSSQSESPSQEATKDGDQKVTLRLMILFAAVFFSMFVSAMTGSIIATVSYRHCSNLNSCSDRLFRQSLKLPQNSTLSKTLDGMDPRLLSQREFHALMLSSIRQKD